MQNKISYLKYLLDAQEVVYIIFCFVLLIKKLFYFKVTEGEYFRYVL